MREHPEIALGDIRRRILQGSRLQLDALTDEEVAAVSALLRDGEAKIINEACKPFVVKDLDA